MSSATDTIYTGVETLGIIRATSILVAGILIGLSSIMSASSLLFSKSSLPEKKSDGTENSPNSLIMGFSSMGVFIILIVIVQYYLNTTYKSIATYQGMETTVDLAKFLMK